MIELAAIPQNLRQRDEIDRLVCVPEFQEHGIDLPVGRDVKMLGIDLLFGAKTADFPRHEKKGRQNALLRIGALWEQPVNIR